MPDSPSLGAAARTPEDVWRVVLAYATDYDDGVSTFEWSDPVMHPRRILNPPAPPELVLTLSSAALWTAMNAMLVSRLWAYITLPLLYTVLPIFTSRQLSRLAERLERSRTQVENGLGRWTRELFVFLLPEFGLHGMQHREIGRDVVRIVRCCPRLRLYVSHVWGMHSESDDDILTSLEMSCGASLRHLCWGGAGPGINPWRHFLALAPGLRTMGMATLYGASNGSAPDVSVMACLEHVTVTSGADAWDVFVDWLTRAELPALWSVTICFNGKAQRDSVLPEFFAVHGTKIRMLKITGTPFAGAELVGTLLDRCPSVTDLFLCDQRRGEVYITGQHPSVRRLAITSNQVGSVALNLRRAFPGLQYLRLVYLSRGSAHLVDRELARVRMQLEAERTAEKQRKAMQFGRHIMAHPAMEGVVLEDWTGHVIA